ncbi:MAG: sugar phosphate isomerase/epimerase [Verrucomicrobia bacterium]|nr:sugar phosphate isomerase/epimerase [Verrucomicrobiota bacterium]
MRRPYRRLSSRPHAGWKTGAAGSWLLCARQGGWRLSLSRQVEVGPDRRAGRSGSVTCLARRALPPSCRPGRVVSSVESRGRPKPHGENGKPALPVNQGRGHARAMNRRTFLSVLTLAGAGSALVRAVPALEPTAGSRRKMTLCLNPGAIGVRASQLEAVELAHRHGFESVEPQGEYLAGLSPEQLADLLSDLRAKRLVWGAAGLPVEFRSEDARFERSLERLPRVAAGLQRAGVERVGTWISPGHGSLTYLQNFRQHATRLREVGRILKDHGLRLGLEYVGTKTSRDRLKYPFVHTLAECLELIAEIGTGNVGVVPDSWHWWQAGDTTADLLGLRNQDVVAVDLNDAPTGIAKDQQRDNQRELPAATGVIDLAAFLGALAQIGYDGPVRAEPFNQPLNELDNEAACAATVAALRKALALLA